MARRSGPPENNPLIDILTESVGRAAVLVAKRMFGGYGIYGDGIFFAIVGDDTLYFKTSDETRANFEAEGAHPFTYHKNGRAMVLGSYYAVPEWLFDEPDRLRDWALTSIAAARKVDAQKGSKTKKKTSAKKPAARHPARPIKR